MALTLPLTILGLGLLVTYLFAGATHALPLLAGVMAGFGVSALGASAPVSFAVGAVTAFVVIAAGRFAALSVRGRTARSAIQAMFALPAAIAGYSLASSLASLGGLGGASMILATLAAIGCAAIAARRVAEPA